MTPPLFAPAFAAPAHETVVIHLRRSPLLWVSLGVVLLGLYGVADELAATPVAADAQRYRDMTVSFWETGEFQADYLQPVPPQSGEIENGHTHYFSPLWPLFQLPFWLVLGESGFELAYLVAAGLALGLGLLTTRHLYGDAVALSVVSFLALWLTWITDQRSAEPLALAFFILMLWAILRSIEPGQGAWILLAGACAGLAYLTRASVGWLFLLGGAAGFLWRLRFHQRRALNRHYLAAIAIFGAAWILWAARNLHLFWDGDLATLPHAVAADAVFEWKFQRALEEPLRLVYLIPLKLAWGLVLLSPIFLLRHRVVGWQLRHLNEESESGRFLAWAVPLGMGAIIAAVFTIADTNPPSPLWNMDNLRYFVFAVPGLLWGPWTPPHVTTHQKT